MIDELSDPEPLAPFQRWFAEAAKNESLADAMTLATASRDGVPSLRAILVKGVDSRGFVFYTNMESRKAEELLANPRAALCFHWKSLQRQVRVEGTAERATDAEADAYFASRPRESQIGAWASDQSRPLASRSELEARAAELACKFADHPTVPRPPNWAGFRIVPQRIEFWQERPSRLHDRFVFIRDGGTWRKQRLFP
jgi:pyridoxamine 5'-phosphate oxidase